MINWSMALVLLFSLSALAHVVEIGVMFHKGITHAITRDELKRAQRLNTALESQLDYCKGEVDRLYKLLEEFHADNI